MKKYTVTLRQTIYSYVEVEALDRDDAENKAWDLWNPLEGDYSETDTAEIEETEG